MTRKPIPEDVQTRLFSECLRRCAVCYGLHRDMGVKAGQIAHLDHDPTNNNPQNLVFLCFDHHDQYDSKTSQSKNFTRGEVKSYRYKLLTHIKRDWRSGELHPPAPPPFSMVFNIQNTGGAGGPGGTFGGGGGGGGAPVGAGGAGGYGSSQSTSKIRDDLPTDRETE